MRWVIVILLALLMLTPISNAQDKLLPTYPDIRYVDDGDYKQKVDIYLPTDAEGPFSTVLLLHGNGYTKWDMEPLAAHFVNQGHAAVAVEFRNTLPEFPQDIFCALTWTHASAEIYEFDISRLVVLGHSLGGFGAALLGVTDEIAPFMENCPHPMPDENRLQGVILYAGAWLDPSAAETGEQAAMIEANLTSQIDGSEPPFLLLHGLNDTRVGVTSVQNFAADLETVGVEVTLVLMPEVGHFFINPQSAPGAAAIEYVDVFMEALFVLSDSTTDD